MDWPTELEAYKFCPVCGGKFSEPNGNRRVCSSCNYEYFLNAKSGANGIIRNSKGELLVIVRKKDPYKGTLAFPGGFVNPDESLEDAFKREIKEELSIDVKDFKFFKSIPWTYPYKGIVKSILVTYFIADISDEDSEKIKAGDDASSFQWIKPEDVDVTQLSKTTTASIFMSYLETITKS